MWNLNCVTQLTSWALFHTCKLVHLPSLSSPFSQLSVRLLQKYLVHFIIKGNCTHLPCRPQAAPWHLPPEPLRGVTDSFPVTGHSCWALTQPLGGLQFPAQWFSPPSWGFVGAQVPGNALLRECVVSFSSPGCKHSSQSLLQRAAVPHVVCGQSQDCSNSRAELHWQVVFNTHTAMRTPLKVAFWSLLFINKTQQCKNWLCLGSFNAISAIWSAQKYQNIVTDLCCKILTQNIGLSQMGFKLEMEETQE